MNIIHIIKSEVFIYIKITMHRSYKIYIVAYCNKENAFYRGYKKRVYSMKKRDIYVS